MAVPVESFSESYAPDLGVGSVLAPEYDEMRLRILLLLSLTVLLLSAAAPSLAQTAPDETPVVHAVFFFSPTCPHCELVIQQHLPGIFEESGGEPTISFDDSSEAVAFYLMTNGTLEVLMVDASVEAGGDLYMADIERLAIPDSRKGVPRVDIGTTYLVGSSEIPDQMPSLVEAGLDAGGLPWPQIPGLDEALASIPGAEAAVTTQPLPDGRTIGNRFASDPLGNGLAVVVLIVLIATLVLVPTMLFRGLLREGPSWVVPMVAAAGLIVSAYLARIETTGVEAVCGPVGDCNAVQQSTYASILGVPIGVLGVVAYVFLIIGWFVSTVARGRLGQLGAAAVFIVAFGGTLFSVYLTFLEPFVIGATCIWCLTSALCIAGLLWLTAGRGWDGIDHLQTSN